VLEDFFRLVEPFFNLGYTVWMDGYYNFLFCLETGGSLLQEHYLNGEYVTHVVRAKKPEKGESVTAECSGIVGIN